MTTVLANLGSNATLTPMEEAVLAELEQEENAYDYMPTRIKFPSGGMSMFSIDDTDTIKPGFKAIVAVSQKARAFWPYKETMGKPPLCSSPDGVAGTFFVGSDQIQIAQMAYSSHPAIEAINRGDDNIAGPWLCSRCPLSQWESAGNGARGQACKSLRRLIVLVEGWTMPAIMTLPPTSIRVFDSYASARARAKGQAYFTVWTRIDLVQQVNAAGIKYSVAKFEMDRPLTAMEQDAVIDIRHQYADLVRKLGIESDDYATDGGNVASDEVHPF